MFSMDNEFAFVVTDTDQSDANMAPFFNLAQEVCILYSVESCLSDTVYNLCDLSQGYNLAFIFNTSIASEGVDCDRGLACVASDLGNILVGGYDKALRLELPMFQEVI